MRKFLCKKVLLKKALAVVVSFAMLFGSFYLPGAVTRVAADWQPFNANLLANGDFSQGMTGWDSRWGGRVEPNTGQGGQNISDNMAVLGNRVSLSWNGMFSDVLTLTQGTYRLSAWARNLGPHGYPREALLGLVPNDGVGREEFNRYGYWTPEGAIQYWVTDEALRAAVPAIRPSVVCFNDAADWVYRSVEFVLCERLIRVFDNGQFRVAFRSWSSYGMYITGITLTKIDDGGGQFADKTALRAAIAAAQGHVQANYTPESWAVLADALSAAQTVYEYADASQLAVDAATEALLAAIAGLVPADTGGPIGPTPLSGTPFGNIPAYAYRAFDGNLDTYYVGGNSGYVGLDLGEGNYFRITGARIAPLYRTGNPWFGTHARSSLQGSVDGITFVTLGEFYTSDITAPTWFELSPVNNAELLAQTFRFFRLLGSQWHNFRVAEVEFFGYIPTPCLDCNLITCECCAVCGPPPCDCCDVCDSFPCVCPPCVTDRPPGTFGNQVYFNDFSANTAGGYYTYGNFRTGHGDKSRSTYAGQGYFLHFPASGGAGVTAAHYSGDTVLTEGNLYVLSITYRTNAQASARFVGVGAPDNPWMHWFDGVPGWAWNGIHVPVSANWTTAYMVFTAGASPNNYSPAILLGRQYGGIGHGTWDVSQITIHELHVDPADKAALASAIAAAEAITDQELYTPATWIAMQAALTTARAVYGNMLATQEAVDAAATALQNAINNLVERTLEDFRTLLNNLIIQGQGLNENDYTPATWAVFAAALANAQAVHGNSAATIPQIRAAMDALQAAINSLVPQQAAILLPNGDFSQNLTGWNGPSWNIAILPNSGLNALNTSANMARVTAGWNRFTSNVIIINEPGFYSLNAWGKAPGTGPNVHLFLTYEYHDGAPERDRDWRWDFVWEIPNMGGPEGSRVRPSVVNFSGLDDWTQLATVFEITQPLIDAHNGRFRVAFRTEGNTGPLYITGIRLVQVCDDCRIDPCLCDEVICRLALAQAIADAEAITGPALLYTPETWAALQTALATARTVYSNPFVVQAVIDNATNALQAAIDGLVPRTNAELRVLLGALIADAEGRNPSDYRAGTWNLVANALAAAQTVYGNAAATNIMLVNAYSALRAAINDLVPMPPELTIGENLFDDGFSRTTTPSVGGWTDPWRATIHPSDYAGKPSYNFITLTNNWSRMNKPIHLQGNVRYRFSAWVRGGGDGPTGVILTPLLGSPRPTGPCGSTLCHDTWCSCESFRIARLPVTTPVANWEFRSVEFVLEADVYAEVMLRSWPTGNPDGLSVSDIRIEVLEVFETYGVTFGAIGGGTVTAAIGLTPILHGAAVRPGTNVTFTANPAIGYTIDRWEVDGVVTNANNRTFTATVNADLDVRVFFIPAQGVVLTHGVQGGPGNVIARANGATTITSGTIAANGSVVPEGSSLAFFATPDAGYEVSHWIVNGSIVHLPGRLFTVAYLQGVGAVGALTFDVQVVFQEIDPTGGRFDPNSPRNTTYRGKMGININRDASQIISGSGLTAVFSDAFVASLAPFGLIRFMNYTNTNNHFTIHDWNAAEATLWGEVIALSNILNADIWVCIPVNASDAYIATLAALLEEHLNPNIVVYVEWGNEVWGFANQRLVNERMIQERGIPTDSRNIWVAHQLWWLWEHYFHFAQRTAEIAFIFRDAFNEDYRPIDVNSRIRPVLTWQVIPNAFAPMIEWLEGTTHTPFHSDPKFRNPHTYLWGVGIAPYFSEPNVAMANCVDHIHRHMLNSIEGWRPTLQAIINNADAAGFIGGAVTYEGGPHYSAGGLPGDTNLTIRTQAQDHPLMIDLLNYYIMNVWFELGGTLYTHYRHLGAAAPWGHWGVKDDLSLEQFKNATKYTSLRWISQQPIGTRVPRPNVPPPPPFASPILNPSFEYLNPQAHWNLGHGWVIDRDESIDGSNSLHFPGSAAAFNWFEVSTPQFTLEPNTEYIFSFWHKGEAGYKIIIEGGGRQYYAITDFSDVWVEYLVPFNTAGTALWNVKIGHEWNANAHYNPEPGRLWDRCVWLDFFHVDENLIYNPSFEFGINGWAHGLGWIGEQNYEVTNTQAFHGNNSLRIFGNVTPDGLNSSQFTFRDGRNYRLVFYHMGDGNFNVPIPITEGLVDITTGPDSNWRRYEQRFSTAGLGANTGQIRTSTTGPVTATYVDNFMLFLSRIPVPSRETVNRAALEALVEYALTLDPAEFTAGSWAVVAAALANAQEVLANPNATVIQINAAYAALHEAINGLEKAVQQPRVFSWDIFNNGEGGSPSRPNAGLAAAGLIRMWTQLDGVNAPVYLAAADTIEALDQDGNCAEEFVRVGRVWQAGTGWLDYFNMLDVNKAGGSWRYINLYITVYGQRVHVLLVNALFEEPVLPVFSFDIFNNGEGGTPSRPNAGLAAAGLIRMWTQLDGVNAPVYFAAADTITAFDQDGNCAEAFIRVGRVWQAGTGWLDYFNMIDVDKDGGSWRYINFTITVYGQTVHVLLVNADYTTQQPTPTFYLYVDNVTVCNTNRHVSVFVGGTAEGEITLNLLDYAPELVIVARDNLWTPTGLVYGLVVGIRGGVTVTEFRTVELEVTRQGITELLTIHVLPDLRAWELTRREQIWEEFRAERYEQAVYELRTVRTFETEPGRQPATGAPIPPMQTRYIRYNEEDSSRMRFDYFWVVDGVAQPSTLDAPAGLPLFISLHGGGGGANDLTNNGQWSGSQREVGTGGQFTYYRQHITEGFLLAPRGVVNDGFMHGHRFALRLYDRIIENFIIAYNIDPNRVYLIGFSAGGDGVYRVSPRMPDRWGAVSMSAGLSNWCSLSLNLMNLPFQTAMGDRDWAFTRHVDAVRFFVGGTFVYRPWYQWWGGATPYVSHVSIVELAERFPGYYQHDMVILHNRNHNNWAPGNPATGIRSEETFRAFTDPVAWHDYVTEKHEIGEAFHQYLTDGIGNRWDNPNAAAIAAARAAGGWIWQNVANANTFYVSSLPTHQLEPRFELAWLESHVRNPIPNHVNWNLGGRFGDLELRNNYVTSQYWLSADPGLRGGLVMAARDGNEFNITVEPMAGREHYGTWIEFSGSLYILLNSDMVDFTQPVIVTVNGVTTEHTVRPCEQVIRETINERGDPNFAFSVRIRVYTQ